MDQREDGSGLDKPRHLGSRLTQAFQEGHLNPEPLCSHRHDFGARTFPAAGVVDPEVTHARAETTRMHPVVAHVGAEPLVVCDDLQLLGGNYEARDLFRMLRAQANRTLKMLRHLLALSDRLELRVVRHHRGEERGQFLEGMVDPVNQGQLRERDRVHTSCRDRGPSRAQQPRPAVHTIQEPQDSQREAVFHLHSPQAEELDLLESLSKVNERRGSREKPTDVANSPAMLSLHVVCLQVCAVCRTRAISFPAWRDCSASPSEVVPQHTCEEPNGSPSARRFG